MKAKRTLDTIGTGERLFVSEVTSEPEVKHRLFDLGFLIGERVLCVGVSPLGDPLMLAVGGKVIAVRKCELKKIYSEPVMP